MSNENQNEGGASAPIKMTQAPVPGAPESPFAGVEAPKEVDPQQVRQMSPLEPELAGQPLQETDFPTPGNEPQPQAEDVPPVEDGKTAPVAAEQEQPAADADQQERPLWPGLPKQADSTTVRQDFETYYPSTSSGVADPAQGELLILPSDTNKRFDQYDNGRPNEELTTESEQHWAQTLMDGELTRPVNEQFDPAVEREGADWAQAIQKDGHTLMAARPRLNSPGEQMLTGTRAVHRVRALLGLGSIIWVPLWESGFWMAFRAPAEGELLDLLRRLSDEKITLGRRTYGLAFANSSSFISRDLLEFAIAHQHDCTLKPELDPRKFIRVHDLQTIAWAMACVVFPKGFQYSRSVLTGEGTEKREVKGLLNVSKLQFVDRSRLSEWQINHMSKRVGNTMTSDMMERYQAEFKTGERRIELEENLFMVLAVPTADQYLESGAKWIDGIADMVDRAFQQPPSDEARDRYISHRGKSTVMRQFGHWVKSLIEVNGDQEIVYDKPETVDQLLDTLSEVDHIRKKYFEEVHKYIDDTTVSVIATPTVDESEEMKLPRYPHLVPIDAQYTFFTLLAQKNSRVAARMAL
ncbi:MAG: hypothetical protein P4L77_10900 [Sulfuriferula sp.]|nr:hypothetical protein [Sulfuriferula sp.]